MSENYPAAPRDLSEVAAFVAKLNTIPASQSLHCTEKTVFGVRRALSKPEHFPDGWTRSFVLTKSADGELVGVLGNQYDPDRKHGWVWGPWMKSDELWATAGRALLDYFIERQPKSLRLLEAFLHVENHAGLRFLETQGFSPGLATNIYTVSATDWSPVKGMVFFAALRPAHEAAFARLHAETFPAHGSMPAHTLLDGRDDDHAIFAATDGLRLLGSLCVSVNHAPLEGFVDYLAVKPAARGRGIGARLLQTALHWAFDTKGLPQAALCVSHWREGARRLYERAGFALHATGIAARRRV